ncbi:Cutinase [Cordyceps fumosorosea ARSEF 2679]|uniref:cutinase n=1 Tax=Cordyceps fumosorosea (strain ARSEF 2679) TaxID=1081104 RepID=A0A168DZM0_CORFA|nr:Cutinase [Cordyceps fumosorosea ARSEF 2679]OAA73193.1 Cutinase [Cordyceps fumosorosea ARSEF 2679]
MKVLAPLALGACVLATALTEDEFPALLNHSTIRFDRLQSKWELLSADKSNKNATKTKKPIFAPSPTRTRDHPLPDPTEPDPWSGLELNWPCLINDDFLELGCRPVMFFFARGSSQLGNMGRKPGPFIAKLLRDHYGFRNVSVQGVGYGAWVLGNLMKDGTDAKGINLMKQLLHEAAVSCQHSKIIVSGYSQGAAVVHAAFETLEQEVIDRTNAIVLFGDTRTKYSNNTVANFPRNKTLSLCNKKDIICEQGRLILNDNHLDYTNRSEEAAQFIIKMLPDVPSKHGKLPFHPPPPRPQYRP